MKFLDIGNITLTKGESSDIFEITSDTSLAEYKGTLRVSDKSGIKHEEELKRSREVKNNDNIYNDDLIVNYYAERYDFANSIYDDTRPNNEPFIYQIKVNDIKKDELSESATVTGKIYNTVIQDTLDDSVGRDVVVSKEVEKGIENAVVIVSLTSEQKGVTREAKTISTTDGAFSVKIPLGDTVKVPANYALLFQISNAVTEKLDAGRYYCTVTVKKEELDKSVSFQKEILQTKLDINEKN